jgi:hypothetical protein
VAIGQQSGFQGFFVFEAGVVRSNGNGEGLHGVRTQVRLCCRLWEFPFPASKQNPTVRLNSRFIFPALAILLAMFTGGCSTPDSRIQKDQAAFAALPPGDQQKIRAGQVDVGFTGAMVRMALGAPDTVLSRVSDRGTEEMWIYRDHRPRFSFGLGIGGGGGSTSVGTGVGISSGRPRGDRFQVTFQGGVVTAIQTKRY